MATSTQHPTIASLHEAYLKKQVSPTEVVKQHIDKIKASQLNAYLTICEDRAMGQAKKAEEVLKREGRIPDANPLLGIPVAIKDNLTIDGVRTTCASRILDNYVPPYTSTPVSKIESAGGVAVGKTNLDEFAMGGSNENSAYGPVKHPANPEYVPGGSSGGSAASVGGGLSVAALGSDTGGSIRLPASFCGIVGLKPTYGRVSRYGLVAFASSLDQVGPLTRNVDDAARVFSVISGHDRRDSTSSPEPAFNYTQFKSQAEKFKFSGLRVGVPKEYFTGGLQPEVESAVQDSLKWFEKQGAKLVPIALPNTQYSVAVYYLVAVSEASSNLARYDGVRFGSRPENMDGLSDIHAFYRRVRSQFGPEVKRRIILGTFALSAGYADAYYMRACQVRRLIKNDFDEAFKQVDLIAGPVAPTTAFKQGEKSKDPLKMYLTDIFTIPANLAGLPALSLPVGKFGQSRLDSRGLPIGLQLQAKPFAEDLLLQAGLAFERGFA